MSKDLIILIKPTSSGKTKSLRFEPQPDNKMVNVKKTETSKFKQKLLWIFLGKRCLLSDDNTLTCPRCSTKLDKIEKNNIVIDVCPFCQGMWLDDGEIEKLSKLT